ncbi:MAG TPA: 3-isopropylmalate dehydrogenase [Candidatus Acidoferrum sp.]|nr:3-isopropylmalate dehydrogenase [Candidatus Acidoferrum sp.]
MSSIAVLPGDGIGPEITASAVRVLQAVLPDATFAEGAVGAAAIASHGTPLPEETIALARASDAILFGAVGGPGYDNLPPDRRPEAAILGLRKTFGLYANVRPARVFAGLEDRSPLKPELVRGMDLVFVRELTGGLYFGEKTIEEEDGVIVARDVLVYRDYEIERAIRFGFELARQRRGRVTSVDKNNVIKSSQLWRSIAIEVAADYPDVTLEHMLVDNAAMQLVRDPLAFDVIVTENMFGDILSDEAAMITGTIGTAASAALGAAPVLGERAFGLYEPISGTAPDIAGRGIANPTGAILSAAMLARFSLARPDAADRIERAVAAALASGPRTADLEPRNPASTAAFTDLILGMLDAPVALR